MELCKVAILKGSLPEWSVSDGSGYGDGYGYGYGDGSGSGSGYGDGYGDGSGYGSGSGYGYGYGDGYGYGYGYGYGDGYGSGSGYGDGYGYGYGDGYGYGYGYGDGSGYGEKIWPLIADSSLPKWNDGQRARLKELTVIADALAFWKSDAQGFPSNGGDFTTAAHPGLIQEIQGPLQICTRKALHATMRPDKWQGERVWIVALFGEVQWQDDKCAALKREIIGEVFL